MGGEIHSLTCGKKASTVFGKTIHPSIATLIETGIFGATLLPAAVSTMTRQDWKARSLIMSCWQRLTAREQSATGGLLRCLKVQE